MTQDEIIEMARQAGAFELDTGEFITDDINLSVFAKLVDAKATAKEREALLNVVYGYASSLSWNEDFQADIRARGIE